MTKIKKPVRRMMNGRPSHAIRPLVVTIDPDESIGLRERGRRTEYRLDTGTLYLTAVAQEVERSKSRRGRRVARVRKAR